MSAKSVELNIYCNSTPCELLIVSREGNLIKQASIKNKCSKICFCTSEKAVIISAIYKNQNINQTLFLNSCQCQNYDMVFNFPNQSIAENIFYLIDANYGFPIKKAELLFRQVRN